MSKKLLVQFRVDKVKVNRFKIKSLKRYFPKHANTEWQERATNHAITVFKKKLKVRF